jgi:D-aminopeptidase
MRVIMAMTLGAAMALRPAAAQEARPRARDLGVAPGVFQPGPLNAITDVAGVRVGQATVIEGDSVRTGVTAILPHAENPYFERVPAPAVGNGFGKLLGVTQLTELGSSKRPSC